MIRFYNGYVLAMDDFMEPEKKEVWVDGDTILHVGASDPRDLPVFEREIDLHGDLVMPSFKNAHAHSGMTFLRSYADDLPLQKWLFDKVIPCEQKLTPEDIYDLTRLGFLESIRSGITASMEMYYHRPSIAQAGVDMGYRTVLAGGHAAGDDIGMAEQTLFMARRMGPLISYIPGCHSEYLADPDTLMAMQNFVSDYQLPFFSHNAETKKEVEECIERNGMTPTQLFEEYGLYENGGGGYHCVWMTEEDLQIFARRGLWAVTCPCSNAKLASGIAPIVKMQKMGINLAIGTDGPASNNGLDMFREMYLCTVLQKLQENDAAACDANSVLRMACTGSARAMGLPDCDNLTFGKKADFIVISMKEANMFPINNVSKNLVYSGTPANVRMTVINGRIVYEDGEFHVGDSAEEICRRAQRAADRLLRG